jgi:hypothetical protein
MNEDDFGELANAREADDIGDADAARQKAELILNADRATVDEIAWAWCTLLDVRAGNDITPREARYQSILSAKEWIEGLGLSSGVANAVPPRARRGVAGHPLRASAVSDVSVDAVRKAAIREGNEWPALQTVDEERLDGDGRSIVNSTGGRVNMLDYITERAIKTVQTAEWMQVYDELARLAAAKEGPFKDGLSVPGCIRYKDASGGNREHTRDAVRRKMERWIKTGRAAKLLNTSRK